MNRIDELRNDLRREIGEQKAAGLEEFIREVARQETQSHFKKIQRRGQRAVNAKRNYGNKGKIRQDIG